jgi:hypothetical protein
MKKVTLNTVKTKKLELKKTAIANLQMSEGQMRLIIGGDGVNRVSTDNGSAGSPVCQTDPNATL